MAKKKTGLILEVSRAALPGVANNIFGKLSPQHRFIVARDSYGDIHYFGAFNSEKDKYDIDRLKIITDEYTKTLSPRNNSENNSDFSEKVVLALLNGESDDLDPKSNFRYKKIYEGESADRLIQIMYQNSNAIKRMNREYTFYERGKEITNSNSVNETMITTSGLENNDPNHFMGILFPYMEEYNSLGMSPGSETHIIDDRTNLDQARIEQKLISNAPIIFPHYSQFSVDIQDVVNAVDETIDGTFNTLSAPGAIERASLDHQTQEAVHREAGRLATKKGLEERPKAPDRLFPLGPSALIAPTPARRYIEKATTVSNPAFYHRTKIADQASADTPPRTIRKTVIVPNPDYDPALEAAARQLRAQAAADLRRQEALMAQMRHTAARRMATSQLRIATTQRNTYGDSGSNGSLSSSV